jgi:hypothetical protein
MPAHAAITLRCFVAARPLRSSPLRAPPAPSPMGQLASRGSEQRSCARSGCFPWAALNRGQPAPVHVDRRFEVGDVPPQESGDRSAVFGPALARRPRA